jgi:amino acid permease
VITAATSLVVVMYALLFGKICESFARNFIGNAYEDDGVKDVFEELLTSKFTYIVLLYFILLPNILKRNIKELRLTSILLIFGVVSMLGIFLAKVIFKDYFTNPNDKQQPPYTKGSIVDSITIVLTAYGFILNFYPIFA